jgi:BASS family bile acid:Na+ symporter
VAPLLLVPFFSAWMVQLIYKWRAKKEFVLPVKIAVVPFYLWVSSIVILSATVTRTVVLNIQSQLSNILILLVLSFVACLLQFGLGKWIGYKLPAPSKGKDYQDVLINPAAAPKTMSGVSRITAGQAFGQKNTSLGVWMAHMYLNPLSSLGAAAYIIWQNLFNSVQLFIVAHKK